MFVFNMSCHLHVLNSIEEWWENGCVAATSWSTSTFEQRAWDSEASHHGAEVQKFAMPQLCGGFRGRFCRDGIHTIGVNCSLSL